MQRRALSETKAGRLRLVRRLVPMAVVDTFLTMSPAEWQNSKQAILQKIRRRFGVGTPLIVRSSAWDEDLVPGAYAGALHSEWGIKSSHDRRLARAIENVLDSFHKSRKPSPHDRVIVQRFLANSTLSGVILTWDIWHDRGYYVINFDRQSGRTDSITSGQTGETVRILKSLKTASLEQPWRDVLSVVRRIESLFPQEALDIEFAIDSCAAVHIFQVRRLNAVLNRRRVQAAACTAQSLVPRLKRLLHGGFNSSSVSTILSDMADWNPAEMLGPRPARLDSSLYRFLITRSTWNRSRVSLGYTDVSPSELMVCVADKPYINVGVALTSLTPRTIVPETRLRLVNAGLQMLKDRPDLHDKIEFYLAFSCSDFQCNERIADLVRNGHLSSFEAQHVQQRLVDFTGSLLGKSDNIISVDMQRIHQLQRIQNCNSDPCDSLRKHLALARTRLLNCRDLGVFAFSRLARLAFVAMSFLRSLLAQGLITRTGYNTFLTSLATVANDVHASCIRLPKHRNEFDAFLKRYGHLRPKTYDITSPRYDNIGENFWLESKHKPQQPTRGFEPDTATLRSIDRELNKLGLPIGGRALFIFMKKAIEAREYAKFVFSRDISDVLETIAFVGGSMGFSRHEMATLSVECILAERCNISSSSSKTLHRWKTAGALAKRAISCFDLLALPPIIMRPDDLFVIPYPEASPNFVTQGCVQANVVRLQGTSSKSAPLLNNSIVLLESADPGYDWVFARHPAGIITKYGGAGSHMMIRCASFQLPAAIGCGEVLFEKLSRAEAVVLDCFNGVVTPLL